MTTLPFFPDQETFLTWIQRMPGITPCHENEEDRRTADPSDPCYPTTEGPYYLTSEHLLLRVGSGASARYHVLVRVSSEAEADYRWYLPAHQPDQEGETVFAAYLWDRRAVPEQIVGGTTLREARRALSAFLATQSKRSTQKRSSRS